MYACVVRMRICMRRHVWMHAPYACVRMYMCARMHARTVCMRADMHVPVYACMRRMYGCVCACMCMYVCVHAARQLPGQNGHGSDVPTSIYVALNSSLTDRFRIFYPAEKVWRCSDISTNFPLRSIALVLRRITHPSSCSPRIALPAICRSVCPFVCLSIYIHLYVATSYV
jgi:hypothetical protein